LFVLQSAPLSARLLLGHLLLLVPLLVLFGFIQLYVLRPWYIFQRCERHKARVVDAALEANPAESLEGAADGSVAGSPDGETEATSEPLGSAEDSVETDWKSERKKLLKQIAVLALSIVELSGNEYKKSDGQPNVSKIAALVQAMIDEREKSEILTRKGTGKSSLMESFRDGLQLLREVG
jgi:hypothetical protein